MKRIAIKIWCMGMVLLMVCSLNLPGLLQDNAATWGLGSFSVSALEQNITSDPQQADSGKDYSSSYSSAVSLTIQ